MIDLKQLKSLIKLMVENDLTELDLQDDKGEKVKLRRGHEGAPVQYLSAPPAAAHAPQPGGHAGPAPPAAETAKEDGAIVITSPMVGTFYAAASPDAEAFASVGDRIGPDTVVCLIEAMKVFNEIKAECAGTIAAILVENGQAVEFGTPLFKVKP